MPTTAPDFWAALDRLAAEGALVIDRPRGSAHPRYAELVYPLDYGYLDGTRSGDGAGVDVWVGSLPERRLMGVVATVDTVKRDVELKLLLGCTPDEARRVWAFHNQGAQSGLLLVRNE